MWRFNRREVLKSANRALPSTDRQGRQRAKLEAERSAIELPFSADMDLSAEPRFNERLYLRLITVARLSECTRTRLPHLRVQRGAAKRAPVPATSSRRCYNFVAVSLSLTLGMLAAQQSGFSFGRSGTSRRSPRPA